MAIVFAAPNHTKAIFSWMVYLVVGILLAGAVLVFFLPVFQSLLMPDSKTSRPPEAVIDIRLGFLDSDALLRLEAFTVTADEDASLGRSNPFSP